MKQKLLLLILFFCTILMQQEAKAQTLAAGDIAFIGFDIGGPDGFSFITLKEIPAGEIIYFTEEGLYGGGWSNGTETHLRWTVPSTVNCGTIISVIETTPDTFSVTGSSGFAIAAGSGFTLAAGDQMLVYQNPGNTVRPTVTASVPTFIAGIHGDYNPSNYDSTTKWNSSVITGTGGGAESILPNGLTNGVNCISLFPGVTEISQFYAKYTGTLTGANSALRASINNVANWSFTSAVSTPTAGVSQGITPSGYTGLSVTCGPAISTSGTGSLTTFTTCAGVASTSQSFNVTGSSLTVGITVAGPTGYEFSATSGGTYTTTLLLPAAGGTVYVRLSTTATGNPGGNVTLASTGASPQTVAVVGSVTPILNITSNPSPSSVCAAGTATFNVTSTNTTAYQWQVNTGSGFSNITNVGVYSGTTTASLTITGATVGMNGYEYKVIVSNGGGNCTAASNSAALTISAAPAITSQPSASALCAGATTTFTTAASNATGYQWQVDPNTGTYGDINNGGVYSGATTATLTITGATAGMNGYLYRAQTTGGCSTATSNGVALTITAAPSVTGNPPNRTICTGFNTTFPVTAPGATSYQWQVSTDGGTIYNDIANGAPYSGVTTATLTVTGATSAITGNRYRCRVINSCGSVNSNGGLLTVITIAIAQSQTNVTTYGGANGTATATPSGGIPTYSYSWSPSGGTAATATGLSAGTYTVTVTDGITCQATSANYVITQPAGVAASVSSLTAFSTCSGTAATQKNFNVNGNGLTADLVVTAPTGYEVSLSPGSGYGSSVSITPTSGTVALTAIYVRMAASASGTMAGNVTVASTGVTTKNVAVTGLASNLTTSSYIVSNATCFGVSNGVIDLTPSGGTSPYSYNWGGSVTSQDRVSLAAGTYSVTITDNKGCIGTISGIVVGQPAAVSGTTIVTNATCFGASDGVIDLTPSGGTGPYTFNWGGGVTTEDRTGLAAGTYSVTIKDSNNCTGTVSSITVGQATAVSGTTVVTNVSCFGGNNGAINLTPTGGSGSYTFNWGGGITTEDRTGLAAGTYSVTITDQSSCTGTVSSITVGQPTSALSGSAVVTNVSCLGGNNGAINLTPAGGSGSYTFNWGGGVTTEDRTGLAAGTYSVTITDQNSCTATVSSITVGQPTAAVSGTTVVTNVSCFGGNNGAINLTPTGGSGSYTFNWGGGITTEDRTGLVAGTYSVTITDQNSCTGTVSSITVGQPAVITANPTQTNVSCNGGSNGSATVAPTGGTGTYTYSWSNSATTASISGLAQGTYTVTIKDANLCQITQSFTITEPTVLVATQGTINNTSCNSGSNGSATVVVTGGTSPYSYDWNGTPTGDGTATISGLAQGTYTVTVTDAKLCQTTQGFTITEPTAITATTSQTDILCNGAATGSASVTASGGTGAYTYAWSPSGGTAATASGLAAGNYSVVIKDANLCQITKTFTIAQPAVLVASAAAQTNVNCRTEATGAATVNVTGGTGTYTYSWSPSGGTAATASGLTAGTYIVTVKDANLCQTTQSFTITQPAAVLSATTASTGVSCFGGSNGSAGVTVSGGTSGYTYLWAPLGGTASSITGRPAGNYTCTITDTKGCTLVKNITINTPAAFSVTTSKTDVNCNGGTNGTAAVSVSGGTPGYTYSWSPSGGNAAIASGLAAGTYTVTIQDANTCTTTASITIGQPAALSAITALTDVLCNGGATGIASVTPSGGTPGYTYAWSPSGGTGAAATGLTTGNYSVVITDANGCTLTKNFFIAQPTVLTATTAQQNATCVTPGQASVTPSGGAGGYTYLWSPSGITTQLATGLAAGNHSCLITDANGCTLTKNFTITTTNTLTATVSQTNLLCNGINTGSATVVPAGAPGPYTYVWSPSGGNAATASNLAAGSYSVTITSSNGCSTVKNFTITEPAALAVTPSQTNLLCNGATNGSAAVAVTGGTGAYTYVWTPSGGTAAVATGLTAGNYTVTIKDANLCQVTQNFTITAPAALVASAASQTNVSCNGGTNGSATVAVTGGTGAYTYVWAPSGGTGVTASGLAAGTYTVTVKDANLCQTTQSFTITEPAVLTATTAQTNVLCNGGTTGTATVTPAGGTAGYTYVWSPSGGTGATATGLTAGNYSVLITDTKGCTLTKNFTITQPNVLVATAGTQINVSCNGGANATATVTVSGGTTPYTYDWTGTPTGDATPTISGLSAGTYVATITDGNGCTTTQSFTITQPAALAATTSQTNAICNGVSNGTATVTVTGGTGAYTYLWAPSGGTAATATGLAAGNYSVTIKDANLCTLVKNFTITESSALTATTAQTNVLCNGSNNGTAGVTVTGGTGTYTYVWAPSGGTAATATGLAPGNYTVTITDGNGCTLTKNFTITEPAVLAATTAQTNLLCFGATTGSAGVTVTGGTTPYTYVWSPSGGTAATATGLAAGNYSVLITDANGCTLTKTFTITAPTALAATTTQTNLLCFGANTGSAGVTVTGGTGAYTYTWAPSGGTAATATGLAAGTYTVTITDANLCTLTKTFTITAPTALAATTSQTNILCFGANTGSASVVVSGGTGAYTYAWAPSGGTAATATGLAAGTYTVTITDANLCTLTKTFTITQLPELTLNGSSSNITCNGTANGMASVAVTGGTAPYTYAWSPSGGTASIATGLSGGTYTCTVTDANGCTKTRSFTIYEQTPIVVTSVKTNILCHGAANGSATVSATGGVPGYTYAWSTGSGGPTVTGLAAGTHTVTVTDALGCSNVHTVVITEPDALAVVISQTNVSCSGNSDGSLGVAVTGGTAPYTYAWTPNAGTGPTVTGLNAGNYSVTITDANGCTALRNFSLTQPAPLTASLTKTDVNCFGGNDGTAAAVLTGGTAPYTYAWTAPGGGTPNPLNLVSGTYTVTITDANGCTFTGTVTINQPLQLLVSNHPQNATVSAGGNTTYTVTAINAASYQWQVSADGTNWTNVINGGTNPVYSGATTNSLTITGAPASHNGYHYRVVLSNGVNCIILSNPALLTVNSVLVAVDDDFSATNILTGTGGIAGDVTANDLFNNLPVNDDNVVITVVDNDGLVGVSFDNDGNLIVPATAAIGTYTVTYSICEAAQPGNCSTAEAIVVITDVTGTVDFRDIKLSIYPNPATSEVFINIPDFSSHKNIKVTIHDLNGRLVKETHLTAELQSIAVTGLESGVYIFSITSDTGEATKRIVVAKTF